MITKSKDLLEYLKTGEGSERLMPKRKETNIDMLVSNISKKVGGGGTLLGKMATPFRKKSESRQKLKESTTTGRKSFDERISDSDVSELSETTMQLQRKR